MSTPHVQSCRLKYRWKQGPTTALQPSNNMCACTCTHMQCTCTGTHISVHRDICLAWTHTGTNLYTCTQEHTKKNHIHTDIQTHDEVLFTHRSRLKSLANLRGVVKATAHPALCCYSNVNSHNPSFGNSKVV